jgi:ABC-2 type transport system ATP-binding protein
LNDPAVLFMDELTRCLDPGASQSQGPRNFIKEEIAKERRNTIFVSTHNLEEAEQLCERVAIFDDGRIKIVGRPKDLKERLGDGSKLSDVFQHYAGEKFEEWTGTVAPGFRLDRRGFHHRGGLGRRRGGI